MDPILDPMLIAEDAEDDDVDDLILLHILHDEELLGRRAAVYGEFDLRLYNNSLCLSMFRFLQDDILRLVRALQLPDPIVVNRVTVTATTGLCMCLRRPAYPNRLVDLEPIFGYSSTVISWVCQAVFRPIEEQWGYKLDNLGNIQFLTQDRLKVYAIAVQQKGCPLPNCWGFIDGTDRAICRPSVNQEEFYSGHTKMHCLKYQSVQCPEGIIINLKGAFAGSRHDAGILRETRFLEELQHHVVFGEEGFLRS